MHSISLKQKLALAREASRGGQSSFEALCEQHGLESEELALWLDAYEAGGEPGLRATEMDAGAAPEAVMKQAAAYLEKSLARLYPESLFEISRRGNTISVGVWGERWNGEDYLQPVFQIRYATSGRAGRGFWVLYWQRANSKWWPYRTQRRLSHLDHVLREVREDAYGCFWG